MKRLETKDFEGIMKLILFSGKGEELAALKRIMDYTNHLEADIEALISDADTLLEKKFKVETRLSKLRDKAEELELDYSGKGSYQDQIVRYQHLGKLGEYALKLIREELNGTI